MVGTEALIAARTLGVTHRFGIRLTPVQVVGLVAIVLMVVRMLLDPSMPVTPDSQVDYLILKAGWDGLDPTQPTLELARAYDLPGIYATIGVTRPPGFFIVQAPQLIDLDWGMWVIRVLNLLGAVTLGLVAGRIWGVPWWPTAAAAALFDIGAFTWGTPSLFMYALVALTWLSTTRGDKLAGGVPLGIVSAVRLWPGIGIVALAAMGRWRAALGASVTAAALTLGGLVAPGVTIESTIRTITDRGWALAHARNYSLSTLLSRVGVPTVATVLTGVALVWLVTRKMEPARGMGVALGVGVLVSPISWLGYWAITAPWWPAIGDSERLPTVGGRRVRPSSGPRARVAAICCRPATIPVQCDDQRHIGM